MDDFSGAGEQLRTHLVQSSQGQERQLPGPLGGPKQSPSPGPSREPGRFPGPAGRLHGWTGEEERRVFAALDGFSIELPSWAFANTGTRFGKFMQPGAAATLAEKFADAGEVRRLTGSVAKVALHVLWDLPNGLADVAKVQTLEG